jgi:very-short-patch-repair endonuclease
MSHPTNDPQHKDFRKELRNHLGLPEVILWQQLKGKQLGVKFRRQYGVGSYSIDFYCHEKKLGVELDGESHNNEQSFIHDENRTKFIHQQGITIIRFQNKDILHNLDGVITEIKKHL